MRFLHAADVHLDSPCSSRSETVRHRLRDASRLAFRRLVDLALSERVDVALIAGDLFDDERLSFHNSPTSRLWWDRTSPGKPRSSTLFTRSSSACIQHRRRSTPTRPGAAKTSTTYWLRLEDCANSDGGSGGVDALAAARVAEKEFSERIATLTGQVAGLEHTCAQAAARTTADQIDGEMDALKSEVGRLKREHDRKIVLAHAVREADGRFREEHQPDVVRRASGYFATITANRYDDIMISDAGELEVRRADDDRILAAGKLSTGTKEQLYLAMRLAALDHLDHDRERLPVFIDEAFVNWDAARRGRGFRLLRELSQTRQVFVMTCHERWAEELIDAGAKRVDLT